MFRPLNIQNKYRVPGAPDRFAFGSMLFLEPVNGDDIPRTVGGQLAYPFHVRRVAREPVSEVNDGFYSGSNRRQFPDAMGKVRG